VPRAPGVIGYLKHDCIPSMFLNDTTDKDIFIDNNNNLSQNQDCQIPLQDCVMYNENGHTNSVITSIEDNFQIQVPLSNVSILQIEQDEMSRPHIPPLQFKIKENPLF